MPTQEQIALSFAARPSAPDPSATPAVAGALLALVIGERDWANLLADEWWPLNETARALRLGVGKVRETAARPEGARVIAWIDPARLLSMDVMSWREKRWSPVPIDGVVAGDEIVWPGPIPLHAIVLFTVESESDRTRLLALAKGFANTAPPPQPIEVRSVQTRPGAQEPPPQVPLVVPPEDWNALRGAAAMAVWSVPTTDPWLDLLCDALGGSQGGIAAELGVPWWDHPPWARRLGRAGTTTQSGLWQAAIEVLKKVHLRDSWRPLSVLDDIREHACAYDGVNRNAIDRFVTATRSVLRDESPVFDDENDPLCLALTLVLLRHVPERFVTWKNQLPMRPAVWWTGATLSGLLQGYRDLDCRFRGPHEARRLLALRTWRLAPANGEELRWPDEGQGSPTWQRDTGRVRLFWGGVTWNDRAENTRARWYAVDLLDQKTRAAAISLATTLAPRCLARHICLSNVEVPVAGTGRLHVSQGTTQTLKVEGDLILAVPANVSISIDLDDEAFRHWLATSSIHDRLPDPPRYRERVIRPAAFREDTLVWQPAPSSMSVPGLQVFDEFISAAEERDLLASVDAAEWRTEMSRRVQHYGWVYNYRGRQVDPGAFIGPLPRWAADLGRRLVSSGLLSEEPDQVIVNEYVGKQGIGKHVDCLPCFRGPIATISLSEAWEMIFWGPRGEKVTRILEPRSATIISGEARTTWKHEIPRRLKEPWGTRGRRVSLTFRRVDVVQQASGDMPSSLNAPVDKPHSASTSRLAANSRARRG